MWHIFRVLPGIIVRLYWRQQETSGKTTGKAAVNDPGQNDDVMLSTWTEGRNKESAKSFLYNGPQTMKTLHPWGNLQYLVTLVTAS